MIDQIAICVIISITFILFIIGKWRYDIVAILSLCLLYIFDQLLGGDSSNLIIDELDVFLGFSHPAVITVATVLIISRALRNSGVVDFLARKIVPYSKYTITHITSLSGIVGVLSAFMNNVGALALMLPVAIKTSVKQNRSPSIVLMPIAFASILGGMITMIGTPPNIIISTFRQSQFSIIKQRALNDLNSLEAKYLESQNLIINDFYPQPFGMLDFTPVGIVIASLGILFVALIGWRLIPKDCYKKPQNESLFSLDEYITEIRIPSNSTLIGKMISEIELYTDNRLSIIKVISDKEKIFIPKQDYIIKEDDQFQIKSDPVELKKMMDEYGIRLIKDMRKRIDKLQNENMAFKEVLITPDSPLIGRGRTYLRRRTSNTLILMAVASQNNPIKKRLGDVIFKVGDVLLLQGDIENLNNNILSLNLVPLAQREVQVGIFSKVGLSIFIFAFSILISLFGLLPTTLSFICAIIIYIITGILPVRDLYKNIDWPIITLLGAMIPVSNALQSTGTTEIIASSIVNLTYNLPEWSIVAIIMIVTMCMSDIVNNAATALIMAPISIGIAMSMQVSIDPFLMSVAVGASCAFLTPIGHQCNALILGPGGYRFSDYWRMGLPLEILIVIIGTPAIIYFWPL